MQKQGQQKRKASTGSERRKRIEAEKRKQTYLAWAILAVLVVSAVAGVWYGLVPSLTAGGGQGGQVGPPRSKEEILKLCIEHEALSMHIHVNLRIIINGEDFQIPAFIGITETCMRPIHTHDTDGVIHLESPYPVDFNLGDFFTIWGQTFNENQILRFRADATRKIRMEVSGRPNTEFQNLVMRDLMQVMIVYGPATPLALQPASFNQNLPQAFDLIAMPTYGLPDQAPGLLTQKERNRIITEFISVWN